jgi:hypothetical protein
MLGPADAGRYFNLMQLGRLSFHHRDATCMSLCSEQILLPDCPLSGSCRRRFKESLNASLRQVPVTKEVVKIRSAGVTV